MGCEGDLVFDDGVGVRVVGGDLAQGDRVAGHAVDGRRRWACSIRVAMRAPMPSASQWNRRRSMSQVSATVVWLKPGRSLRAVSQARSRFGSAQHRSGAGRSRWA